MRREFWGFGEAGPEVNTQRTFQVVGGMDADRGRRVGGIPVERATPSRPLSSETPVVATTLALQRKYGNGAVAGLMAQRRDALGVLPPDSISDRAEPVAAAAHSLVGDVLLEQMAHNWTYVDTDILSAPAQAVLSASGYKSSPVIRGVSGLEMRVFTPLDVDGIRRSIVSFRGTEEGADVKSDLNPNGVGFDQYYKNLGLIAATITRASSHGAVIVTGHSLGGALAQIAASEQPGIINHVVTFQSAGITVDRLKAIEAYNIAHPDLGVFADHHRAAGDVVPVGGEAFFPGRIHNYKNSDPLKNLPQSHTAFPVTSDSHSIAQDGVEGTTAGWSKQYESRSVREENEELHMLETVRQGIGLGFGAVGGALLGGPLGFVVAAASQAVEDLRDREAMQVWGILMAMVGKGTTSEALSAVISASELPFEQRMHLRTQILPVCAASLE